MLYACKTFSVVLASAHNFTTHQNVQTSKLRKGEAPLKSVVNIPKTDVLTEVSEQSIHLGLYGFLRRQIAAQAKPGDLLPSQNELASLFDVSALTIRQSLSMLADQKIIKRQQGLGTTVLDPHTDQHIAVLIELDISSSACSFHFRRTAQVVRNYLQKQNIPHRLYIGTIFPGTSEEDYLTTSSELIQDMTMGRITTLCTIGGLSLALKNCCDELNIPVVGDSKCLSYRIYDNHKKFLDFCFHKLKSFGCQRPAVIAYSSEKPLIKSAKEQGYDLNPEWMSYGTNPVNPNAGWQAFKKIFGNDTSNEIDSLLITDEMFFNSVTQAILANNINVPEELLLATHFSKDAPYWCPFPVIRFETDPTKLGEALAQMAMRVAERDESPPGSKELNQFTLSIPGELKDRFIQ
jgi:DNA-binding transcriptional regulator YhcF (GntR family)